MKVIKDNTNKFSKLGEMWHSKIRGRFKKEGLTSEELDKNNKKKSIDFLVYKKDSSEQEGFLCEVKSIISGGFDQDIKAYTSSADPRFLAAISTDSDSDINTPRKYEYDYNYNGLMDEIENKLQEALNQYNQSNTDKKRKPFVVVLCFDFFAGFPGQVNFTQLLENYPPISAIMMLERDSQREQIKKGHLEKLNRYYKNRRKAFNLENPTKNWGSDYNGTQDTVDFKVYINRRAAITFKPEEFFEKYIRGN